ncbi:MAG: ATP-binding protein, partial [Rhodocyclaceae bacterium]|nr:ATP-binding protein [Rhodocyclaceae bacterium]
GLYEFGLVPALDWLANEMKKQFGLNVRLRGDDKPDRLAPDAAAVLFRSVRELLVNVANHARVRSALVEVRHAKGNALEITVSDAGQGFAAARKADAGGSGFGLASMREHMNLLGGSVHIDSEPKSGTTVTLRLPLVETAIPAKNEP